MQGDRSRPRKVLLSNPRGFCAGVDRAIEIVKMALELYDPLIYVRKQIVHNRHVIESLSRRGAIFVDELDQVPEGAVVIFSAHGVAPDVITKSGLKKLQVINASCPLVNKVHLEVKRFAQEGLSILLVGHAGHDEVIGTMGEAPGMIQLVGNEEEAERVQVPDPNRVAVTTQTTLSVDDAAAIVNILKRRFPNLVMPPSEDICYATQNRQAAVKQIAREADVVLVLASDNSSNSERLREVAKAAGAEAYLIDDASEIQPAWLEHAEVVGITAGASAPESLVQDVVAYFKTMGAEEIEELEFTTERVTFTMPFIGLGETAKHGVET
ncbi:MAG: 4-hydroxy-3-methylbut-2-enyl diphosphate reductase [Acidobacteria bacterium]|nr:4-hydroxy-3-methylbut-2-enyl diphosphate reductase [Acidobacteriota bacterium]